MVGRAPQRTLVADLGSDPAIAERYIDHVLRVVFAVHPQSEVTATFRHVSPLDTKIGF